MVNPDPPRPPDLTGRAPDEPAPPPDVRADEPAEIPLHVLSGRASAETDEPDGEPAEEPQSPDLEDLVHRGDGEGPGGRPALAEFRRLDPSWVPCERVGWVLFLLGPILGAPVAIGLFNFSSLPWWGWLLDVILPFFVFKITLRAGMAYTRRAYARTRWLLTDDMLEIHKGVWWRKVVTVPRNRVQHTDVTQGPIQRRYGIATLVLHTAGTQDSTVSLEGLARAEAEAARDHLLAHQRDDAV